MNIIRNMDCGKPCGDITESIDVLSEVESERAAANRPASQNHK